MPPILIDPWCRSLDVKVKDPFVEWIVIQLHSPAKSKYFCVPAIVSCSFATDNKSELRGVGQASQAGIEGRAMTILGALEPSMRHGGYIELAARM